MLFSNFTAPLVALLAGSAMAAPEMEKRTSSAITVKVWGSGSCTNSFKLQRTISAGGCVDFGSGANFGGTVENPAGQHCVVKYWSGAGCTGKAATWYIPPGTNSQKCIAIANQGNNLQLTGGAQSLIANCAQDVV